MSDDLCRKCDLPIGEMLAKLIAGYWYHEHCISGCDICRGTIYEPCILATDWWCAEPLLNEEEIK